MWINDGILEKNINPDDIIPEGFIKGRKPKPKKIDTLKIQVNKEDLIQYFIIDNHSFIETMKYFNLPLRNDLVVLLKYYKIAKTPKQSAKYAKRTRTHESYLEGGKKSALTQKQFWGNKSDKEKKEWSDKQKIAHSTQSFRENISKINIEYQKNLDQKTKDYQNKQRSNSCKKAWSNKELIIQQHETAKRNRLERKQNGQLCRTKAEQMIYDKLIEKYDVVYDKIIDERYPYFVDFYIKSLDLFIEYQGHPSHGNYPYIENDSKSIEEANRLYGDWRNQYLHTDYDKFKQACKSNINLIRIYPNSTLQENINFNNHKFTEIIELIYSI